jgi:hypothetical protein
MEDCRERNELLAALTLSLESLRTKTSKRMLQLSTGLQEDLEETLSKQRASLTTAQRLQRKILEMLPVVTQSESDILNPEAHMQKAHSDETDCGSLATPKGGKSDVSAASKPPLPLLQEALASTIVLGLPGPADEYQVRSLDSAWPHIDLTCQISRQVAWEKSCQLSRGSAWLQPLTTKDSSYCLSDLESGTDYRFRYRMLLDGSWSEWSKAVIYGTKRLNATGDEVSGSSGLDLSNPILFWPNGAETAHCAQLNSTNSKTDAVSKAWSEIMDEIFERLNLSNKALISRLQQSLEEFDRQDSSAMIGMEIAEAEPEIAIVTVAESEVEARSGSPEHFNADAGVDAQKSPRSSSAPVQRARTKADLRLGCIRVVSSPKDMILPRPVSPTERELKRARLSPSAFGGQPTFQQDSANSLAEESDADRPPTRMEHDAKERQVLSLKLAARVIRLHQAGADSNAKHRSPSPSARPIAMSDQPASPAACQMGDHEAVCGVAEATCLQKVVSETVMVNMAEAVNIADTEAFTSAEETSEGSVRRGIERATTEHQTLAPLDAPAKRNPDVKSSSSRLSRLSPQLRDKPAAEAPPAVASLEQSAIHAEGPRPKPADDLGRPADSATSTGVPEASDGNRRPPSTTRKTSGEGSRAGAAEEQGRGGAQATNSRSCRDAKHWFALGGVCRLESIDAVRRQVARGGCRQGLRPNPRRWPGRSPSDLPQCGSRRCAPPARPRGRLRPTASRRGRSRRR